MNIKHFLLVFMLALPASYGISQDEDSIASQVETFIKEELAKEIEQHQDNISIEIEADSEGVAEKVASLPEDKQIELIEELVDEIADEFSHDSSDNGFLSTLVELTAICFSLGMPIIIIALLTHASYRKRRQRNELIQQFLDADKDVPEVLLNNTDESKQPSAKARLSRGLILIGIGVGIIVAFFDSDVSSFGAIPVCIGIAYLIVWKLENRNPEIQGPLNLPIYLDWE